MADDVVRCGCCGVPLAGSEERRQERRCMLCDLCDHRHGDELQHHLAALLRTGQIDPWFALARMSIDDAHLACRLGFVGDPRAATMWIAEPLRRWEVVVGRALARGELPDISLILQVTLARFIPGRATPALMQELSNELASALTFIDPNVVSVDVACRTDALDPEHLLIKVRTLTAAMPGMVSTPAGADVEIPHDVMMRPRGQA